MQYAKIWAKTLASDEKVQIEFSIGDRYQKFRTISWGIISLLLFFFGIYAAFLKGASPGVAVFLAFPCLSVFLIAKFYFGYYLKVANAYAFTNKRVLIHRGWLSTHTISVDYAKITDVHITEPIFERFITHTGNIAIITAGSTSDQIVLLHVKAPYEIKKQLDSLKDK